MHQRLIAVALAGLLGAGCAQPQLIAIRMDGEPIAGDLVRTHAYEADRAICIGETQKANMSGVTYYGGGLGNAIAAEIDRREAAADVMRGCMAQKGYALVPEADAEAKRAEFRAVAIAAEQRRVSSPPTATGSIRR